VERRADVALRSRSTSSTQIVVRRAAARLMLVVVLPTPPFCEATEDRRVAVAERETKGRARDAGVRP
jgi:hypothetical protein